MRKVKLLIITKFMDVYAVEVDYPKNIKGGIKKLESIIPLVSRKDEIIHIFQITEYANKEIS